MARMIQANKPDKIKSIKVMQGSSVGELLGRLFTVLLKVYGSNLLTDSITKLGWFGLPLHLTARFHLLWCGLRKDTCQPHSKQGWVIMSKLRWEGNEGLLLTLSLVVPGQSPDLLLEQKYPPPPIMIFRFIF